MSKIQVIFGRKKSCSEHIFQKTSLICDSDDARGAKHILLHPETQLYHLSTIRTQVSVVWTGVSNAVPRSHLQGGMGAMVESSAQILGLSWWALQGASVMDSRAGFHFFVISKCRTKLTLSVFLHWTSCAKHRPIEMCVLSSPGLKFGSFEHKVKLRAFGMGCCLFCLMDCLKGQHRDEISLRFVNVNKQY